MPKILVADDNTNIQKMVSLAFSERGIEVIAVGNGEAAVRRLPDLKPDLVLADIFMPVRNGYEVCEYVKRDPRFSHIPVILLVGAFDPLDEKEAHRVGADGVLKKPFVPPDPLIAMVTSVLEKNPKLAAELAAAKREKAEPAPLAVVEAQSKAPAKVQEFPEPTPEEAAVVYAFGSGRRTLEPAKVPSEPQAPISDTEEPEEFDGAATTSDWRRSAMDFEVSEEDAKRPAFADDNLNSAGFRLDADAPPQNARILVPAEKVEQVAQEKAPEKIETPRVSEEPAVETRPVTNELSVENKPDPVALVKESEPEVREMAIAEPEPTPEPSFASKAAGWIESIFPSKYPQGGWLSSIKGSATKTEAAEAPSATESSSASHSEEQEPSFLKWKPEPETEPEAEVVHAPIGPSATESHTADEDSFFADEPEDSQAEGVPEAVMSEEPAQVHAEPQIPEPVVTASERPTLQFLAAPPQAANLATDPALIEPPAVRVVPEPLLVDDEPQGPTGYGGRREELPALHSFLVPPPPPVPAVLESVSEPVGKEVESKVSLVELPANGERQRIPTGPPPNREALAEIPFLSPPPVSQQPAAPPASAVNSETVDAVVRKVLERLEPQLHEMLSKGLLKPIVENILQNELQKKEN